MDYEEKSDWALGENKPNSKPIKANLHFTAENTEYAQKKDISVSDCSIEKYALYAISPCSGLGHPVDLRTRRLMKNKAKTKPIKANFKRDDGFSPQVRLGTPYGGVPRTAYYTRDCQSPQLSCLPLRLSSQDEGMQGGLRRDSGHSTCAI